MRCLGEFEVTLLPVYCDVGNVGPHIAAGKPRIVDHGARRAPSIRGTLPLDVSRLQRPVFARKPSKTPTIRPTKAPLLSTCGDDCKAMESVRNPFSSICQRPEHCELVSRGPKVDGLTHPTLLLAAHVTYPRAYQSFD